jgi:16S rRNA (uracil1498-N3)-methyltransferase
VLERVFCDTPPTDGRWTLDEAEAHHLARVRRVPVGELVEVFDGCTATAHRARVVEIRRDLVRIEPTGETRDEPPRPLELTMAVAFPKGDRLDWLIEKCAEVGVARIVPLRTERSVVDPRPAKVDRLRRRLVEACKQCGRNRLPELEPPSAFAEVLGRSSVWSALFDPRGQPLAASPHPTAGSDALIAIGPEGGFSEAEIAAARDSHWRVLSLGPFPLRIETAAIVSAALLLHLTSPGA